jgi:hypothetical protein
MAISRLNRENGTAVYNEHATYEGCPQPIHFDTEDGDKYGNKAENSDNKHSKKSDDIHTYNGRVLSELQGGELVLLHTPLWPHPLLGLVQGWDPENDIKGKHAF